MGKFISRFFLSTILLVLAGSAFADQANTVTHLTAGAVSNHTDLSISYLSQVFGNVGDVLHGTSGQMLGHLFYILNQGILIVAGLWLGYTTITVVLKSAQEGSFMGVNKNVAVLFLKIALGFGLLMPNPTTGYSIFQDVVMKVVVEGVALADLTWDNGLSYMNQGGSLWHRPEAGNNMLKMDKISKLTDPIQQVFASEVCMIASNAYYEEQSAANNNNDSNANNVANTGGSAPRHYTVKETSNSFQFPGVGNQEGLPNNEVGNCGSVTWTNIAGATGTEGQYTKNAVSQIVNNVLPAAHEYFCASGSNLATGYSECNDSSANYNQDVPESFFGGIVDYVNAVYPFAQYQANKAGTSAKNFMNCSEHSETCAQSEGWMMAGRYYWDLSQVQAHLKATSDISNYVPSAKGQNSAINGVKDVNDATNNAAKDADGFMKTAITKVQKYIQASGKGDTGGGAGQFHLKLEKSFLNVLITPIGADFSKLLLQFAPGQMNADPISFLHDIGMDCIAIAGDIWIGLGIIISIASVVTMVCRSSVDTDAAIQNVSAWLKPLFMVMATALLGVGVTLGYYVPLYPYMLFTFGVIGWIIAVIEAMVAAPLVCLGLTHPEGHDFLGAAQQALMLLLSVFLRPVLMVIGLIGGMIMSYVSFRIVIYTFSGFISDLFYLGSPTVGGNNNVIGTAFKAWGTIAAGQTIGSSPGGVAMTILVVPLVLIVFTMLIYVVTNQCFSLIYLLPDNILRWIGGPQSQSVASQMAQEIKGAMSGFGKGAGEAFGKGTSSLKPMPGKGQMDVEGDNESKDGGPKPPSDNTPTNQEGPSSPPPSSATMIPM